MNVMKIFMAFIAIMVLAFFAIGFADTVQAPTNTTALNQYNNLSQATDIASSGMSAVMLLLIFAMIIGVMLFLASKVRK